MRTAPSKGYDLPLWKQGNAYRSTALAYMEREKVERVQHFVKGFYSKNEIKNSIDNNLIERD